MGIENETSQEQPKSKLSAEQFRQIQDKLNPNQTCVVSDKGILLQANESFYINPPFAVDFKNQEQTIFNFLPERLKEEMQDKGYFNKDKILDKKNEPLTIRFPIRTEKNEIEWHEWSVTPTELEGNKLFNIVHSDITKIVEIFKDQLTGFYEKEVISKILNDWDPRLPITFGFIDVNGLKLTNDSLGHEAGDKLIKEVSEILKTFGEGLVSRWGKGDEFLLVIPGNKTQKEMDDFIEKLNFLVGQKNEIRQKENRNPLSFAMGFASMSEISGETEEINDEKSGGIVRQDLRYLIYLADQRMFENKTNIKTTGPEYSI